MRISAIQMKVCDDKRLNVLRAAEKIEIAAKEGADIAILPEMFICPYSEKCFAAYSENADGESLQKIAETADKLGIYVVAGSIPERDGGKLYNTSFVYNRCGDMIARHRKVHLFDIDVENGQRFFESNTFSAGEDATVFDTEFCKIGLCICFDMRFPELSRAMTRLGARLIIAPAAFNLTTGPAHWEIMLRSRAIDNQVFVVGAEPARDIKSEYVAYGNSMVCSPWGEIVECADENECVMSADINIMLVDKVREELPLIKSLRNDVYRKYDNV